MNILHVFGTRTALEAWLMGDVEIAGAQHTRSMGNGRGHIETQGVRFNCIVVQSISQTHDSVGNQYDMILYHDSFARNLYQSGNANVIGTIRNNLNAFNLRP